MTTYVQIRLSDKAIMEQRDFAEPPPDVSRKGIAWLPLVIVDPSFDPDAQVKAGPVDTVGEDAVTRAWSVRDMTADELAARQEEKITAAVGTVGLPILLDVVNTARGAAGQDPVDEATFKAQILERLS
jgi:hypothetical protein